MNLEEMSKEELIKEIQRLNREKKYGLIWENKPENVDELMKNNYPVLTNISDKDIITNPDFHTNILIEGDNLHSLYLLNVTHKESIDCIIIDPPYNTGNKDFIYNDQYVDSEDAWRHSKWISFMYRRLILAKDLLAEHGVIFIHIDENEFAQLKLLCDEIFDNKNFIGAFVWKSRSGKGGTNDKIAAEHEYIYCYAKKYEKATIKTINKVSDSRKEQLRQWGGQAEYREERQTMFFPLLYKPEEDLKATITDEEYERIYNATTDTFDDEYLEELKVKYESEGWYFILPYTNDGRYGRWRAGRDTIIDLLNETDENKERIIFEKEGDSYKPYRVYPEGNVTETAVGSLLLDKGTASDGTKELKTIFKEKVFDTTKPLEVTKYLIDLVMFDKTEGIVLDFFAGSGTTGHAVLEYNKRNNKNIKFILCTNNEMKEETKRALLRKGISPNSEEFKNQGVCRKVTYPRIKAIIQGYDYVGKTEEILNEVKLNVTNLKRMSQYFEEFNSIIQERRNDFTSITTKVQSDKLCLIGINEIEGRTEGIPSNLKYYITDLIPKNRNKDQMKFIMTQKISELLCIKENCFTLIDDKPYYKIYKQRNKVMGIYTFFMETNIQEFKEKLRNIQSEEKIIYSFSFTNHIDPGLFSDLDKTTVKAIPTFILDILDDINRKRG